MSRKYPPPQPGDRYGRLVVVRTEMQSKYGKRELMALVACDCGAPEHWTRIPPLRTGGKKSCGCHKRDAATERMTAMRRKGDIKPGNRYGLWTVIGEVQYRRVPTGTVPEVLCRCDCGTERVLNGVRLRTETRSCGCVRSPRITFDGESKTAHAWARDPRCEVDYNTLRERLKKGEPFETARLRRRRGP